MRISHIRFQPIEGGALGGHFALHITLGAESDPESFVLSPVEITTKIHSAYETLGIKAQAVRGVLFDTRFADVDTTEMFTLLGTIRDWKLTIIAWVNEDKRCAWFELVNYLTVFVRSKNWPNFKASEIRLDPNDDLAWAEPEIYEVNGKTPCYVNVHMGDANIVPFICSASHMWGVVLPTRTSYSIEFPIKED